MSLRDLLQDVYDQFGQLTPDLVVQVARNDSHPLHPYVFDKETEEAAEAYYRTRAHELIQRVKVVYREADENGPEKSVRAFHAVPSPNGYVYEPVERIVEDDFTRKLLLSTMEREWRSLYDRYSDMEEFLNLVATDTRKARRKKAA